MIYTSYYANYRKFKGMFRVSISRTAPSKWYRHKRIIDWLIKGGLKSPC